MNYEKKYKDALVLAKCYYGNGQNEFLDTIFPELTESEDERIRKALLGLTYLDGIEPILTKCCITRREIRTYLEKQKEQKPAEWSEEDENALKYLHELISFGFAEKFCDAQTAADMREWLNTKLKSLRPYPHWKPSGEQMGSLLKAEGKMRELRFIAIASHLAELYEQLKKLM